jgi:iron-sulfur cluster assembly protein
VRTTGCSGLAYTLEFVDQEQDREVGMEYHDINGVRIYMDPQHRVYLSGMTIDYQRKGLNEGFEFINENEGGRCGCGESWYVKE